MRDLLFVHNNFPAQFGFIAEAIRTKWRCAAIGSRTARTMEGIPLQHWSPPRGGTMGVFPLAIRPEADTIRGLAAAEAAHALKQQGFNPEIIVGHPGWGEMLFLKEVFPKAKSIAYCEFYYRSSGADVGFDPEFGTPSLEAKCKVHAKNLGMGLSYLEAERLVAPTAFQASLLPESPQGRVTIIHEGVDVDRIKPKSGVRLVLNNGKTLDRSRPVITFANRRFEPMRGFHVFMRALPRVLAEVPDAEVLLIGADDPNIYGARPATGTWKQQLLAEVGDKLDLSRVHYTGWLTHEHLLDALSISRVHVYFSYPFALSWSMLEAMAMECLILGSDTAPVREVIEDGTNGFLVDFFDVEGLANRLIELCRSPSEFPQLRKAARQTIEAGFDRSRTCLPAWVELIESVAEQ